MKYRPQSVLGFLLFLYNKDIRLKFKNNININSSNKVRHENKKGGETLRSSRNKGLAVLLIGLGALILLGVFGPLLGWLFSLLIPLVMIGLGYYGIKRGNTLIGWIVMAIGIISLLGKLSWLFGPLLGIALIVWGVSRLKRSRRRYY
ncbi:hypothetical protein E6C60_3507 [Paenibacillus algicola]|uniref:DUF4190 domain-containing protein n=1 Tax=Paenibacillus algicola TaxID=2565926 RepID=A0A4P8XNP5_9BACL|nr:hypothetical protein E6C60_3507 [Paenibacillus algicola]